MEQLLEIDGAIEFFLLAASKNVNWKGSSTDIERNKLEAIANEVNRKFGTALDALDISLTWAKFRSLWETWVLAKHYAHRGKVNSTTGTIEMDDFAWDQLERVVPGAEVFRRKPMILPNVVCSIFDRTPSWLAPEEHSRQRQNMSSSKMPSRKRKPSFEEIEEEEIKTCMLKVYKIDELESSERNYRVLLRTSLEVFYALFMAAMTAKVRKCFASTLKIDRSLLGNVVGDIQHLIRNLHWARIDCIRRGGNRSITEDMFWTEDVLPIAKEALY
ncbi:hypothetical protein SO802_017372 [Lithocarpus litseifolius]|uniref:Uncharacterized protein n=1 Tax=Lithocarpus litseifolius TaxID=425828 RepID=A0AAW2CKM5_9ROSI